MKYKLCPLCNSVKVDLLLTSVEFHGRKRKNSKKLFKYYQCSNCLCLYLYDVKYNQKYYDHLYYNQKYSKLKLSLSSLLRRLSDRYKLILIANYTSKKKKYKLLDIGMGNGEFLHNLANKNIQKYGIDIKVNSNFSGDNITAIKGDFLTTKIPGKYDIVTMWHVLEHVPDQNKLFTKIKSILVSGGLLIISTPNTKSLGLKFGGNNWFHLDPPRHVLLYNYRNLTNLLNSKGFETLSIRNGFLEYPTDLFWSIRRKKYLFLICLFYPLIKFISRDTLIVICTKK